MARKSSPWYWPKRNGWFTILNGSRHSLGEHPADLPPPHKRRGKWVVPQPIETVFHSLLAAPPAMATQRTADPENSGLTVCELLDRFLQWCQKNRAPRTYEWYRDHLQSFLNHLGKEPMPVTALRAYHIIEWADSHPTWSNTYRRGAIIAAERPFRWAEAVGHLDANPVKKIEKPRPDRRESYLTLADFAALIAHYEEGDPFRDLLVFCWHTGCRPQEAINLQARHVQLAAECIVIPREEAKGKRRARVILLDGQALGVITRRMVPAPQGNLFTNEDGTPWTRFAIANRFDRLVLAQGIARLKELDITIEPLPRFNRHQHKPEELAAARAAHQRALRDRRKQILSLAREHGSKVTAYDLRHAFCQRLLEGGANHLAVAELMGHSTGRMVTETYSHMNRATEYLKETLKKACGGASA